MTLTAEQRVAYEAEEADLTREMLTNPFDLPEILVFMEWAIEHHGDTLRRLAE